MPISWLRCAFINILILKWDKGRSRKRFNIRWRNSKKTLNRAQKKNLLILLHRRWEKIPPIYFQIFYCQKVNLQYGYHCNFRFGCRLCNNINRKAILANDCVFDTLVINTVCRDQCNTRFIADDRNNKWNLICWSISYDQSTRALAHFD